MNDQPLEVKLVKEVRTCRTCKWFWGGVPPYGNFPVFDWNEDFPEEIRSQKQTTETITKPALKGKACGQGQVDPGIMHGCRKAPIMTVGINPNMTSYFPSSSGARWSYPNFSNEARYAYYYRHHNVYQESLATDFIKDNVIEGSEIIAEKNGWLIGSSRSSDHRWLLLNIQYENENDPVEIEVAWTAEQRFVVFVDRTFNLDQEQDESQPPIEFGFKKGDLIGGKIEGLEAEDIQIYENTTGYYQRYVHVLESFKKMAGGPLEDAELSISEDVAQHDMIGCASPGWSSAYDIPTDRITKNCVIDNAWLLYQLIQSKPSVIVIVGGSSLAMFARIFAPFLKDFDYEVVRTDEEGNTVKTIEETYKLLKETVEREKYLHIKIGDYELKSRIVISPHFSYGSNFYKQSRLSENAWQAFKTDFHNDAQILKEQNRIPADTWNNITPVQIDGPDDPIQEELSAPAWNVLMAYYYAPIDMLASVLLQEYKANRLTYDDSIGRLKRTEGSCKFCVNDQWQFPEGCPYGKDKETPPKGGELEAIVQEVISISQGG